MNRYEIFKSKLKEELVKAKQEVMKTTMVDKDTENLRMYQGLYAGYESVLSHIGRIEEYISNLEKANDESF